MALFQPTNVIPSSFTNGVVDAEQDIAQVSWQVNGNSAMTAYEIDFYLNQATAGSFKSTGKLTDGIPSDGFFGTDRFGQPRIFTWTAKNNATWKSFQSAFVNGQQFKFKITMYWKEGDDEQSVSSMDFYVFKTKATPQITINLSNSEYQQSDDLVDGAEISTSVGYFNASYLQAQGDAVRWARWQISTASYSNSRWSVNDILFDTGEINTPALQFEFNGFFNNQSYAVRCLVESESGQMAQNSLSQNSGWIFFTINLGAQGEYDGEFTLQCASGENAALLKWTSNENPPSTTGTYMLNEGSVQLDINSTISWSGNGKYDTPWNATVEFNLENTETIICKPPLWFYQKYERVLYSKGIIKSVSSTFDKTQMTISSDKRSVTITILVNDWEQKKPASSTFAITLNEQPFAPVGQLAALTMRGSTLSISTVLSESGEFIFKIGDEQVDLSSATSTKTSIAIDNSSAVIYVGGAKFKTIPVAYDQTAIDNIQISGGETGATFRCVTIYKGNLDSDQLDEIYSDEDFKPSWYAENYKLYMTANFEGNIDGGEVAKFRIYRQEIGSNTLYPIFYSTDGNVLQLKDFGIVSKKSYTYWLYEYDRKDGFLKGAQCVSPASNAPATISTNFNKYSLLVCDYDSSNDTYHVRKQYLFALNLSEGSVGNNNSPMLNANFTAYPTRMPSTQNYASGTLQGLIGVIYTVPALIEQIGGIKHLARPSTLDYFDSVDLEKELYDLSVAPYQLFLRDMKGHLRMIATNGAISMTTNLKQRQQSISISLPWVEIGDASDVAIIQTPDDYGWNNDNQVLDVHFDVDPLSGVLSANYPNPYNGTKFYLTGVDRDILSAKTPVGVKSAGFDLSAKANKPEDGILTATVNTNSEEA